MPSCGWYIPGSSWGMLGSDILARMGYLKKLNRDRRNGSGRGRGRVVKKEKWTGAGTVWDMEDDQMYTLTEEPCVGLRMLGKQWKDLEMGLKEHGDAMKAQKAALAEKEVTGEGW